MLHAVIAAYILCFAGGVTLVSLAWFAARRLSLVSFRDFALLFAAASLIMVVEALKTYERAVGADFGPGLHIAGTVLSVLGNAGMCWYLTSLAFQVVRGMPSRARIAARAALASVLGILGGLKEAAQLLWTQAGPAAVLWDLDFLALLGVHVYAAVILFRGFKRIESQWLQSLVRSFLIFFGAFALLAAVQFVVQNIPVSPGLLHDYPFAELLYYLGFVILAVVYLSRYYAQPERGTALTLPELFVRRFGISHREQDIIEMLAKGFSNRAIADKLYISTVTVKNHVYHIYQKTGARNKVQLLNIIDSSK